MKCITGDTFHGPRSSISTSVSCSSGGGSGSVEEVVIDIDTTNLLIVHFTDN